MKVVSSLKNKVTKKSKVFNKIIKKILILLLVVFLTVFISKYFFNKKETKLEIPVPTTFRADQQLSFRCNSLMSANMFTKGGEEINELLDSGFIEGVLEEGTDELALEVKEDENVVNFISIASVRLGDTEADEFLILKNNTTTLIAVWSGGTSVQTITMNKSNGLTVWTKGNSSFPTYRNTPYGHIIYLLCK